MSKDSSPFDPPNCFPEVCNQTFEAPRTIQPTICLICDRPAKGFHCDVASCKGCKTFFRRMCTLPTDKTDIKCLIGNSKCFDGSNQHSPVLRCRACRYQKCIGVGMNPKALELNKEESKAPNYQELKKKHSDSELEAQIQIGKQMIRTLETGERKMQRVVDSLTYLESKLEAFRSSAYNPQWPNIETLEILLTVNSKISMAEKMGPMPGWPISKDRQQQKHSPEDDSFWETVDRCIPESILNAKMWIFYDLMTAVEYAKTFEFFHKLDMEDRLILMRHVAVVIMNLHNSYFTVSSKFEKIVNPDGSWLPFDDRSFGRAWNLAVAPLIRYRLSRIEYILLKSISFCNSAVPCLSLDAQHLLSTQRELHASALFDYCQRTRKGGVSRYVEILGLVGLLERQQKMQKDCHMTFVAPHVPDMPECKRNPIIDEIMNS